MDEKTLEMLKTNSPFHLNGPRFCDMGINTCVGFWK